MVALAEMRAYASELYDNEKRPALVEKALRLAGAEAALNKIGVVNGSADKVVTAVAAMTTVAGLLEKKAAAIEIAAPYIAKARDADGRKELRDEIVSLEIVQDGKTYVQEKVVEPISARLDKSKELAAPYVASAKEYADPYVAKLAELRKSERVESMVAAFQQAREHPAEKAAELRATAVDLISYDNLRTYRDHVMSAEFQADTIQLVKVDLPAIVASAAERGASGVKSTASTMKEEMDKYSAQIAALVPSEGEVRIVAEKVKATGSELLIELQAELASGVDHVKAEGFSLADTIERLKRVVSLVEKMVVVPLIKTVKDDEAGEAADVTDAATGAEEGATPDEAEDFEDAAEEAADAAPEEPGAAEPGKESVKTK